MIVCVYRVVQKDGLWFIEAHRWFGSTWGRGVPSDRKGFEILTMKDLASDKPITKEEALSTLRFASCWVGRYLHYDNPVAKMLPLKSVFEPQEN